MFEEEVEDSAIVARGEKLEEGGGPGVIDEKRLVCVSRVSRLSMPSHNCNI